MPYTSSKTFGHDIGLSCCFRQWRAESHCRLLHGYALAVHVEFAATELDVRNWVVDFGSLKSFRGWLEDTFDHTLLVAQDDPHFGQLQALDSWDLAKVVTVPATGCEQFAKLIYEAAGIWLKDNGYAPRVWVDHVRVSEHGANSASYNYDQFLAEQEAGKLFGG